MNVTVVIDTLETLDRRKSAFSPPGIWVIVLYFCFDACLVPMAVRWCYICNCWVKNPKGVVHSYCAGVRLSQVLSDLDWEIHKLHSAILRVHIPKLSGLHWCSLGDFQALSIIWTDMTCRPNVCTISVFLIEVSLMLLWTLNAQRLESYSGSQSRSLLAWNKTRFLIRDVCCDYVI